MYICIDSIGSTSYQISLMEIRTRLDCLASTFELDSSYWTILPRLQLLHVNGKFELNSLQVAHGRFHDVQIPSHY